MLFFVLTNLINFDIVKLWKYKTEEFFLLIFDLIDRINIFIIVYACMCVGQRMTFSSQFSLFIMWWVLRIEFRSLGLVGRAFTYWAVWLVKLCYHTVNFAL